MEATDRKENDQNNEVDVEISCTNTNQRQHESLNQLLDADHIAESDSYNQANHQESCDVDIINPRIKLKRLNKMRFKMYCNDATNDSSILGEIQRQQDEFLERQRSDLRLHEQSTTKSVASIAKKIQKTAEDAESTYE